MKARVMVSRAKPFNVDETLSRPMDSRSITLYVHRIWGGTAAIGKGGVRKG